MNTLSELKKSLFSFLSRKDLNKLAVIYGSDKWGEHAYTPHYMLHFESFRNKKIKLLEVGIGGYKNPRKGGNSLRMWKRYFSKGQIYGVDIYDKFYHEENRIKVFQGSQIDTDFMDSVTLHTGMLDIIIDDGSHINEHVITTFKHLFEKLKDGGVYVIEDTQTSYWPDFGGDSYNLNSVSTTMGYFKSLIDGLNHNEFIKPDYEKTYFDKNIKSIHFYHNLIFIYKGDNLLESNRVVDNERFVRK